MKTIPYSENEIANYNLNYLAKHANEVLIVGKDKKLKPRVSASASEKVNSEWDKENTKHFITECLKTITPNDENREEIRKLFFETLYHVDYDRDEVIKNMSNETKQILGNPANLKEKLGGEFKEHTYSNDTTANYNINFYAQHRKRC